MTKSAPRGLSLAPGGVPQGTGVPDKTNKSRGLKRPLKASSSCSEKLGAAHSCSDLVLPTWGLGTYRGTPYLRTEMDSFPGIFHLPLPSECHNCQW